MFEAIRSKLVGAWQDLHARGLPSLFLFELVVVTLGVLLAQGVANWVSEREARQRLDVALPRVEREIQSSLFAAKAWQVALPCFRERVDDILTRTSQGEPIPAALLVRPALRVFPMQMLDEESDVIFRRSGDAERSDQYAQFDASRVSAQSAAIDLADLWLSLAVLHPKYGEPSALDRANAKHDAARMLSALRRIELSTFNLLDLGGQLGLEATEAYDARMPRDCADIWKYSDMAPDPRRES